MIRTETEPKFCRIGKQMNNKPNVEETIIFYVKVRGIHVGKEDTKNAFDESTVPSAAK